MLYSPAILQLRLFWLNFFDKVIIPALICSLFRSSLDAWCLSNACDTLGKSAGQHFSSYNALSITNFTLCSPVLLLISVKWKFGKLTNGLRRFSGSFSNNFDLVGSRFIGRFLFCRIIRFFELTYPE